MKFGLFYQLPCTAEQSEPARYQETIEQIVLADQLGFDVAWLAELHFFRNFSIMPSPLMVAVAVAQRTRRIRLGTAVTLLPFHHPLRAAEEAATADLLTGGRLEYGVGRGTIAVHFQGFGMARDESRERFEEALEIIVRAWTEERVTYKGRFYEVADIAVEPRPLQKPHPPIRIAANSPETAEFAGRKGYDVLVASPINPVPGFYEHIRAYRAALKTGARPEHPGDVAALFFVCPHTSRAAARAEAEQSLLHYFRTIGEQAAAWRPRPVRGLLRLSRTGARAGGGDDLRDSRRDDGGLRIARANASRASTTSTSTARLISSYAGSTRAA